MPSSAVPSTALPPTAVPSTDVPCLVGCTGAGKTDVAIALARGRGAEVISCDAFAVYREMPILTAAPTAPSDVPHHLVGILGPDEVYDAARFVTDADHHIDELRERGKTPLIVGGTALYLRCWLKGMGAPIPRDDAYRKSLHALVEAEGRGALHARLTEVDPARAEALHPNDLRRIVRALEITRATGRPASEQRLEWTGPDRQPARVVFLRRTLEDLDARIARRSALMFEAGVVDEARALLARRAAGGLSPQAAQVLGLDTLQAHLEGTLTREEARERLTQRTRRFARKQITFFKGFDAIEWVDVAPNESAASVAARVSEVLN